MSPTFGYVTSKKSWRNGKRESSCKLEDLVHYSSNQVSSIIWAISLSNARLATQHYSSALGLKVHSTYIQVTHTLGIETSKNHVRSLSQPWLSMREWERELRERALTPFFVLISHLESRSDLFFVSWYIFREFHTPINTVLWLLYGQQWLGNSN